MKKEKILKDISRLINFGKKIHEKSSYSDEYEIWYSEALTLIQNILPNRLGDFKDFYKVISKGITMGDEFQFVRIMNELEIAFLQQLNIVKSTKNTFESSLFEIKQLVQADLFDNELEKARELNKKGFVRAAGAIAGVVLEEHLLEVCNNHDIKIKKKKPGINDLSQLLKKNDVIDITEWKRIQYLGGLRNLCDHKKEANPTKEQVEELIIGVEKIIKNIF